MANIRVNFEVNRGGTVNSIYLWVENKNVTLRNDKGYLFLEPREKVYELIYLARGQQNSTIEITTTSGGFELSKQKDTIVKDNRVYGIDVFKLKP